MRNDYSFSKRVDSMELFNSLMSAKLSEPLSKKYRKALYGLASKLRQHLEKSGAKGNEVELFSRRFTYS